MFSVNLEGGDSSCMKIKSILYNYSRQKSNKKA